MPRSSLCLYVTTVITHHRKACDLQTWWRFSFWCCSHWPLALHLETSRGLNAQKTIYGTALVCGLTESRMSHRGTTAAASAPSRPFANFGLGTWMTTPMTATGVFSMKLMLAQKLRIISWVVRGAVQKNRNVKSYTKDQYTLKSIGDRGKGGRDFQYIFCLCHQNELIYTVCLCHLFN